MTLVLWRLVACLGRRTRRRFGRQHQQSSPFDWQRFHRPALVPVVSLIDHLALAIFGSPKVGPIISSHRRQPSAVGCPDIDPPDDATPTASRSPIPSPGSSHPSGSLILLSNVGYPFARCMAATPSVFSQLTWNRRASVDSKPAGIGT